MPSDALPPVLTALAALVEECAHMRARSLPAADDPNWWQRALRAEAAGRELLLAWLRPTPFPAETSLGAELKRLLGLVETLVLASSPLDGTVTTLTVVSRHVELPPAAAWILRDVALLIVLAAHQDGALDFVLSLYTEDSQVRLRVESDKPGFACLPPGHPRVRVVQEALALFQGDCARQPTKHGSWLMEAWVPVSEIAEG
jgi:hypothetical protein